MAPHGLRGGKQSQQRPGVKEGRLEASGLQLGNFEFAIAISITCIAVAVDVFFIIVVLTVRVFASRQRSTIENFLLAFLEVLLA